MTQTANNLRCAIIVPVYNGERTIERCLDALAEQTVEPTEYEILVVDDGSHDNTCNVVNEWREHHETIRIRLLHQENAGPAAARNFGAREASAPLLLFTDADCAPLPGWISALLRPFEDEAVVGAKGTYVTEQESFAPRFVQAEYEDRYDRMAGQEQIDFIDTYSAAYRRDIFLENGGFDPIFTTASVEDQELSFRLAGKGYRLVFEPDAQVSHLHDSDLKEYMRRKYYIGYWKALLARWHPERMVQDSHTPQVLKLQIVLVAMLLATGVLMAVGLFWPPLRWLWVPFVFIAFAFVMTTLPFLNKLARNSWPLAFVGLFLLGARAIALGLGFLVGTVHFAGTLPGAHQPVIPGWKRIVKRLVDVVGALVGLFISIPLVAIAALAVKFDTPGPAIYHQVRIGEDGRPFRIIKLRSMVQDADAQLESLVDLDSLPEPVYKIADDPRVTRVGRILRRTSLDEAPQLINVLRGDMSLVGPRPEDERIVRLYTDEQRRRLAVKPGLTGPMQINGRGNLCLHERLKLEINYIDNYSLLHDFEIMLRTIPAIFRGSGAY